ncbi:ZCHC3 protein, partial [Atractosteus spatula]|nr:ZCHC3 protein [Atractosteus spatula]
MFLFLSRYVDVVSDCTRVVDRLEVWTGRRQFAVILRPDSTSLDGFKHPPASFALASDRGYLFYVGQPKTCRRCLETGHTADTCSQVRCRNCNELGHLMKDCKKGVMCTFCGDEGHVWKNCYTRTFDRVQAMKTNYSNIIVNGEVEDAVAEATGTADEGTSLQEPGGSEGVSPAPSGGVGEDLPVASGAVADGPRGQVQGKRPVPTDPAADQSPAEGSGSEQLGSRKKKKEKKGRKGRGHQGGSGAGDNLSTDEDESKRAGTVLEMETEQGGPDGSDVDTPTGTSYQLSECSGG